MRYLLDTNIISDLVRNPAGNIAKRIRDVGEANVCTSIIVACELRFGVAKRNAPRLTRQLEAILQTLDILPFESPADIAYADLRTGLEKRGIPISANDMLIAAHAIALGCTLVTANEREFARIDGLQFENWLK
ncbi:type II toxin-antitoxin system VapC family toxin [Rhodomicrobium sp. Az07]|uniref:type II toxin-antitoxin system VapC family toxin n=1 Tax=Rhodomicrobium sp. Az07 TaxID=2839034 RepID=UPI001BE705F2|nr:type II toxin-antitoxin system VapC family toxin [Rhodomicrobium sp. Az07]MBT3070948.1 type II toxin-antitoxin system VapC family toxin [Rhodomicrobium sp. Az07]